MYQSGDGFGPGAGPILYSDIRCQGDEATLKECATNPPLESCAHSSDVGVKCEDLDATGRW